MSNYESKKLKIVVGMGCTGLFLLACLAYNLGGANQQAKDVLIQNNMQEVIRKTQNSLSACQKALEKEDGMSNIEYYKDEKNNLETSLNHLNENRDLEAEKKSICMEEQQVLSESKAVESEENYVLASKKIQEQIDEMNYIIKHIEDEKQANRTSLKLKIRVFRQENKLLNERLQKKKQQQEEEERRYEDIKTRNSQAAREVAIGEDYEGDREVSGAVGELIKTVSKIDDNQRHELYSRHSEADPEYEDHDFVARAPRPNQAKRRMRLAERQVREEYEEYQRQRRTGDEREGTALEEKSDLQLPKVEDEAEMSFERKARMRSMMRARQEAEIRRQQEEEGQEDPGVARRRAIQERRRRNRSN
eukprot:TRINITY_DN2064_c0_g4_i2.p1 TRINITY_DN2064_c0_g4~~TRINITY_DN2064_c0_g4_i2.p1  ORF type:complete len:375 (+),score=153.73 TRINITY_DN2064_c0_g4_i2:40-1125(+)